MKDALNERLTQEQQDQFQNARQGVRIVAARVLGSASHSVDRVAFRAGLAFDAKPTASEVIANYSRGWLLFGLRRVSRFEWRRLDNRAVITADTAKVPKRLRSIRRKLDLEIRFGQDHSAIIEGCQEGRQGWITQDVADVYREVHELGFLSTVGAYKDGELVGGFWGPAVGGTFGIMSMFHRVDHAGALALAAMTEAVSRGEWSMLDCGLLNENFRRYGAYEISTPDFCDRVWRGMVPGASGQAQPSAGRRD